MISSVRFGLIVLSLVVTVGTASAQRPEGGRLGGGMLRGMGAGMLLRSEAVQDELKLTAEQKEKLASLAAGRQRDGGGRNPREMSQEERQEWMAEMREQAEQGEKKMDEILSDEQRTRLKQIRLQMMGPTAFGDPEFAKELGLSGDQKEKLEQLQGRIRQARQDGNAGENIRQRFTNAVMDMLSPEQKEKLESLRGKPFDTSALQFGGRRRN